MTWERADFQDEDGSWLCNRCGACCHLIGYVLPEFDRGDKACRYLTEDSLCAIYEERPDICRATLGTDEERIAACHYLAETVGVTRPFLARRR